MTTNNSYRIEIMGKALYLADTYDEAVDYVHQQLPGCELGHPGDITDGGDRTMVWVDEADAEGDDGSQAIAEIRVRRTEVQL